VSRIYRQQWAGQPNTFYNIDIHAYTHKYSDRRGRDGEPVVFTFVNRDDANEWGVKFEDQLRGDYSLLPHTKYNKAILDSFDFRAKAAPPPVHLSSSRREILSQPRGLFAHTKMAAAAKWLNSSNVVSTHPHTDYIVRGVNRMIEPEKKLLHSWLRENFSKFEKFTEGWDDFSESWRFRCFKANKQQGL
jgi:hypothetical protein